MFFVGSDKISWITYDFGEKIKAINTGFVIETFLFHYLEPKWGLFSRPFSVISKQYQIQRYRFID